MVSNRIKYLIVALSPLVLLSLVLGFVPKSYASGASLESTSGVRLIIVFNDGVTDQSQKDNALARLGAVKLKDLPLINGAVVAVAQERFAAVYSNRDSAILRVELDFVATIQAEPAAISSSVQTTPWGVSSVKANQVWDKDHDGRVDTGANTGAGVRVAVIDTGISLNHPDLVSNIAGGINLVSPGTPPQDDNGHGTHIAGIIAATDNSIGVVGVAPGVALYSVKALNSTGSGFYSDIISALEWAVTNRMQVVNMSFGGPFDDPALHLAIIAASHAGIVLVAAAGNAGPEENSVSYPGKYPEVITVAATDSSNEVPDFSSSGHEVELAAPGVNVLSTYRDATTGALLYATMSGTSMASPHVAGAAALVIASGITDSNKDGLINDEVRIKLASTATDLGPSDRDDDYGFGLVNALAASSAVTNVAPAVTTTAATTVTRTSATLNGTLTGLGSASKVGVSFLWGVNSGTSDGQTPVTGLTAKGAFSADLNGLTPGVTYYVRAVAAGDTTTYGPIQSFRTTATAPRVLTLAATSVRGNSATLNGRLASLGSASDTKASFLWGTTPATASIETTPVDMTSTGDFSATVTGLSAGTRYYFRAVAVGDGAGLGSISSFVFTLTPPSVASNSPAGAATGISATSATLNGNLLRLGTSTSVTVSFLWGTTAATVGGETAPVALNSAGPFSAPLAGLKAGTRYYYRAKAVGDGTRLGAIYSFVFTPLAPRVISYSTAGTVTSLGSTSATLNGSLASLGTAKSVTVTFTWGSTASALGNKTASVPLTSAGRFSISLTGLAPGTKYYYRARAEGDGTGLGEIRSFATTR